MAEIIQGPGDDYVLKIKRALDEYERAHPGSIAHLYRQNSASVRVRIIDPGFKGISRGDRHDRVFDFLAERLDADTIQEISVLLLLAPNETSGSFMNQEFENPVPSSF